MMCHISLLHDAVGFEEVEKSYFAVNCPAESCFFCLSLRLLQEIACEVQH